jgi:tRNA1Val (adenine37-N6)-methyltransferase
MAFRFKQFIVEDDRSTMRTGTDAVLLGAWADPGHAASILEIGTGCGVISLMLAQKSNAGIVAIDVDEESVKQADINFRRSPWNKSLQAFRLSFPDQMNTADRKFDLILTNPPFFTGSLPSPDGRKNRARHTSNLSRNELLRGIQELLDANGKFLIILPVKESTNFTSLAGSSGLFLQRMLLVTPKTGKPVNRVLSCFSFIPCEDPLCEELVIRNADNSFTKEYIAFTEAYYFSLR